MTGMKTAMILLLVAFVAFVGCAGCVVQDTATSEEMQEETSPYPGATLDLPIGDNGSCACSGDQMCCTYWYDDGTVTTDCRNSAECACNMKPLCTWVGAPYYCLCFDH
jgi:hypothetical protein